VAKERRTFKPHDRLTRIANEVGQAFYDHPEHRDGDKCIVMVIDDVGGGTGLFGYEHEEGGDITPMVDMFMHLRAIFRANGKDIEFIGIPNDASGLTP
jgi:hypothetical protein